MCAIMRMFNISKGIVNAIEALYKASKSAVLLGDEISDWFSTRVGVRQGCLLSPTIFNVFLEYIMLEALDGFEGSVSIGGRTITNLRFADDIDLVAGNPEELCALTTRLENSAKQLGMQISAEKSKVMRMGSDKELDVSMDGEKLGNVTQLPRSHYHRGRKISPRDKDQDSYRHLITCKAEAHMERQEYIHENQDESTSSTGYISFPIWV